MSAISEYQINQTKISQDNDILTKIFGNENIIIWYFTKNLCDEEVSTNPITFLRPGLDIIALPNLPDVENVWNWAKTLLKYSDYQVYFYNPFTTKDEERNIIQNIILYYKDYINQSNLKSFKIFPFMTNYLLNELALVHEIEVLNDDIWSLPDKSWFHPNIPGSKEKSPEETFNLPLPKNINILPGYTFYSFEQLHIAKKLLEEKGITKFMIKNVIGLGGEFLWPIRNENEFELALKEMNFPENILGYTRIPTYTIEEFVEYDVGEMDTCYTPIVHYLGQTILPGVYYQYCLLFGYAGMNNVSVPSEIEKECIRQSEIIYETFKFKGPWGIDFVVDRSGKVFVIDINYGRICGSHYFRLFADLFAKDKYYCSWTYPHNPEIHSFFNKLTESGLSFDVNKKRGIMPHRVIDRKKLSIMCIGNDMNDVNDLKEKFLKIFD